MKQKEPSKFFKGSLFTVLAGAGVATYAKRLVFGNPPSKLRKAVFWSAIGGALLYNSFNSEIATVYNDFKTHINDSRIEKIRSLKEINSEYENTIRLQMNDIENIREEYRSTLNSIRNSSGDVANQNRHLSNQITDLQTQNSNLEARIENLLNNTSNRNINYGAQNTNDLNQNISVNKIDYWYVARGGDDLQKISEFITGSISNKNIIKEYNGLTFDNFLEGYPIKIPSQIAVNKNALRTEEFPNFVEVDLYNGIYSAIRNSIPGFTNVSLPARDPRARAIVDYNVSLGNNAFNNRSLRRPGRMIIYVPNDL